MAWLLISLPFQVSLQAVRNLSEDEKELGVCVVDMGSGTMDISIYVAGALKYRLVLDYAGNSVTNDIAIA
ncbi:cell division FtsA domain-containing protein [Psychromonas sp. MME2]|uniref:cell division FtsA domain-containing protein n=1 Tax=Psychromonas sp. MME2 TaxID=3231033 RepID=UPI00339C49E4